jgi:uncharacterized protein (DUF433 family)
MLLGHGVYSFDDAARLTRLKPSRVREWFCARPTTKAGAVFQSDFADETSQHLISFLDLIDVFVAGQLREQGVSLQNLRRVYRTLQREFEVEHPFGRKELLTDGTRVFLAGLDERGQDEVYDVLTRQKAFPRIIRPFLNELHFESRSNLAAKWRIAKGVVINPEICSGQPVIEGKGIPTRLVAKAVVANDNDKQAVADWYGMSVEQVSDAVRFEAKRAA